MAISDKQDEKYGIFKVNKEFYNKCSKEAKSHYHKYYSELKFKASFKNHTEK